MQLSYRLFVVRALRAHLMRSILAMTGIVIGIAAVSIVVGLAEGARGEVSREIASLGSNLLLVRPGAQVTQGVRRPAGSGLSLTAADAIAIAREVPDVLIAAPYVSGQETVTHGDVNWSTLVAGVTANFFDARGWTAADGRLFGTAQVASAAKVAVIGKTLARELFRSGDALGQSVRVGRTSYEVIGVLAEKGQDFTGSDQDDVLFIPLSSAMSFTIGRSLANPDAVHTILVKTDSADSIGAAESWIDRVLRQRHRITAGKPDDFRVQNLVQIAQTRDRTNGQITLLVSALAGISLLVGGIGVMNVMLIAVSERTNEIGIRMVVGACPADIRKQFLLEAIVLCAIGGLLGLATGYAATRVVSIVLGWPMDFDTAMALIALGCSTVLGIVFGLLPAERAARLHPSVALRCSQ